MTLRTQEVNLNFAGSLKEEADSKLVEPGSFLELSNVRRSKDGALQKRYGFSTALATVESFVQLPDDALRWQADGEVQDPAGNSADQTRMQFSGIAEFRPARDFPFVAALEPCDVATDGTYVVMTAPEDSIVVYRLSDGALMKTFTGINHCQRTKVTYCAGSELFAIAVLNGAKQLKFYNLDTTAAVSSWTIAGAGTVVASALEYTAAACDLIPNEIGTVAYLIARRDTGAVAGYVFASYVPSTDTGTLITTVNDGGTKDPQHLALFMEGSSVFVLFYVNSTDNDVYAVRLHVTTGAETWATQQVDTGTFTYVGISRYSGANVTLHWYSPGSTPPQVYNRDMNASTGVLAGVARGTTYGCSLAQQGLIANPPAYGGKGIVAYRPIQPGIANNHVLLFSGKSNQNAGMVETFLGMLGHDNVSGGTTFAPSPLSTDAASPTSAVAVLLERDEISSLENSTYTYLLRVVQVRWAPTDQVISDHFQNQTYMTAGYNLRYRYDQILGDPDPTGAVDDKQPLMPCLTPQPPYDVNLALIAGGLSGAYNYKFVPVFKGSRGEPSAAYAAAPAGNAVRITLGAYTFTSTRELGEVEIYRTKADGSIYYYLGTVSGFWTGAPTFDDDLADALLEVSRILYTDSGQLASTAPPPFSFLKTHRQRLWGINALKPNELWPSKLASPGIAAEWSVFLAISVPDRIVALASLDDKLIIFGEDKIFLLQGEGPDNLGQGGWPSVKLLYSAVGCTYPTSAVKHQDAIYFQYNDRIYQLARNLSLTKVSDAVEDSLTGHRVLRALSLELEYDSELWFVLDSDPCEVLVFQPESGWTAHAFPAAVTTSNDACVIAGRPVIANLGTQDITSYRDSGGVMYMTIVTPWLKFANLQGFQRLRYVGLLGEFLDDHDLTLEYQVDYVDSWTSLATLEQDVGGTYSAADAALTPYQAVWHLPAQKCAAIRFRIKDALPAGGLEANYDSAAARLSGMWFNVGTKLGGMRKTRSASHKL